MADERLCECCEFASGLPCGIAARWLVQVGTRKIDAQSACGRHLSMTCQAMYEAEGLRRPVLTVSSLKGDGDG